MPKLYFRYGTMGSSKTANLIMTAVNYQSLGRVVTVIKPSIDTRSGDCVSSRCGMEFPVDQVLRPEETIITKDSSSAILVDEAQFLSEKQVEQLRTLSHELPVICYGLRTDYRTRMFPGSKRLLELADSIEEVKMLCGQCERKAIHNVKFRLDGGVRRIIHDGSSEPDVGGDDKYIALCSLCYSKKKLGPII